MHTFTLDDPPYLHPGIHARLAIIGGGPAGLMAAEAAASAGAPVDLFDAMPSVGRKLLLAGKGGLNLTHAEPFQTFLSRYGDRCEALEPHVREFAPDAVRAWAAGLGVNTFTGSSQRVFPADMKAAPLLRAWLRRLKALGVRLHARHRWQGWSAGGAPLLATPAGLQTLQAKAVILALGGGSWTRLGSDGAWRPWLQARDVTVHPLRPANCGFNVAWSAPFAARFAGCPVKPVVANQLGRDGQMLAQRGEFVVTRHGVEGSLIYALSAPLRDDIERQGYAELRLDLVPDRTRQALLERLRQPRHGRSLSNHLKRAGLGGVKAGLLRERLTAAELDCPERLADACKALPLRLDAVRPLDEAISSAGGVAFESLDAALMLRHLPGWFCAGEMLDWEAPTGGYLLTACLATGRAAGLGAAAWLKQHAVDVNEQAVTGPPDHPKRQDW